MSEPLPTYIDPVKLAQRHTELTGELPLATLSRLAESLCETAGTVQVDWQFHIDEQHRLIVTGHLQADLRLLCQRCLQPMAWPIANQIALVQLAVGQTEEDLPAGFEAFEYTTQSPLLLREWVEDELILALPLIARHQQCPRNEYQIATPVSQEPTEGKKNPFAALAALKNK